nr:MAG TPA_asm: hypothetical protein [Caudoviricetes sp.]
MEKCIYKVKHYDIIIILVLKFAPDFAPKDIKKHFC